MKVRITGVKKYTNTLVDTGKSFIVLYKINGGDKEESILIDEFEYSHQKDMELYTRMFKKVRINSSIKNIMSDIATRIKGNIEFEVKSKEEAKTIKKALTSLVGQEIEV